MNYFPHLKKYKYIWFITGSSKQIYFLYITGIIVSYKDFCPQHSFIIITIPTPQMNIISETSHDISNDTKKEKAPPTT